MKRWAVLLIPIAIIATMETADARIRRRLRVRSARPRVEQRITYRPVSYRPANTRSLYADTRTETGTLSENNVYAFRKQFTDGQSRRAMWSALGQPKEQYLDRDVWYVQKTGLDGKPTQEYGRFVARYGYFKNWDSPSVTHAEW